MKLHSRSRFLALVALLGTGLWAAQAEAQEGEFEERLSVGDGLELDVTAGSGRIEVRAGDVDEAVIRGEIRVNRRFFGARPRNWEEMVQEVEANPPIELSNNRLKVGYFDDKRLRDRLSISYEITVPASTEVVAKAGSGSVSVSDIMAPVEASTGSGSVDVENIGGPVEARTGSGSIRAIGVGGAFEGSAGSGRITMSQTAPGDVDISNGSGSSELTGVVGAVNANSGSGSITIQGTMTGNWNLDTGSGGIRIALPDDAAFELDAETGSGGIDIEHPLTVEGKISKRHLRGTVRGGGHLLAVETGSGGIRIR